MQLKFNSIFEEVEEGGDSFWGSAWSFLLSQRSKDLLLLEREKQNSIRTEMKDSGSRVAAFSVLPNWVSCLQPDTLNWFFKILIPVIKPFRHQKDVNRVQQEQQDSKSLQMTRAAKRWRNWKRGNFFPGPPKLICNASNEFIYHSQAR